jgi:hypothetical protein
LERNADGFQPLGKFKPHSAWSFLFRVLNFPIKRFVRAPMHARLCMHVDELVNFVDLLADVPCAARRHRDVDARAAACMHVFRCSVRPAGACYV